MNTNLKPGPGSSFESSLELQELCKTYDDFVAVDRLSLKVPAGSVFGLLGPNGAGKTTTIRMIMDIIAPDSGMVLFGGRRRSAHDFHRIGYLPEERGLYRKMKVIEQLVFLGRLHGLATKAAAEGASDWLERLGLADRAERKVEELSKGQQQKIQLAGTLIHDPELVILDEPFSGLDPINQSLFKDALAEFRQRGRTVLFSTHVMEQAEKLCDHIALISDGRVVLEGELAEIKRRFGAGTFRLRGSGAADALRGLDGIKDVVVFDDQVHLSLHPEADPGAVLRATTEVYSVTEFMPVTPDLEEIFVRTVQDAT